MALNQFFKINRSQRVFIPLFCSFSFIFTPPLLGEIQENALSSAGKEDPPSTPSLTLPEAIMITLNNQREIQISEMKIIQQSGLVQESAGPFDPVLSSEADHTISENRQYYPYGDLTNWGAHETTINVGLKKETRAGTRASIVAEVDQIIDPLGFLTTQIPNKKSNQGFLTFTLEQPLARGLLYGKNATLEMANRQDLLSFILQNLHVISSKITETTNQYWEVVAAQKLVKIQEDTVKRFEALAQKTEVLIRNEELAKSDILQPQAQLEQARINKILAIQQLYSAIQTLLYTLGISEEGFKVLPKNYLSSEFPEIPLDLPLTLDPTEGYVQYALYARNDIRALKIKQSVADILIRGGYNELLPQLDLIASVTKTDFRVGNQYQPLYSPLSMPHPETDYVIGMRFSYPFGNDAAKGNLTQQKAIKQQLSLATDQISQSVFKDILDAWSERLALSKSLKDIQIVVKKYEDLVRTEGRKLAEGFSTLFVLIDFEDRLTNALSEQVILQKRFMQNTAQLRYLTSTVIIPSLDLDSYTIEDMTKEPEISMRGVYND